MKVGRESVRVAVATKTSRSGQRDEGKGRERPVWKKEGKRTHENALVFRERHAVSDRSTTVTLARSGKGKVRDAVTVYSSGFIGHRESYTIVIVFFGRYLTKSKPRPNWRGK
ncbi:uncharacterized protein LOC143145884 isoform X1 [Ptiloglossa arizonensis]|uniref:uncharacterized protein LOC143145884 isoform X1 n=1 Tax=Ptiloglossa arizonensis TaxID=3350558 RepID=UPI003FA02FA6